MKYRRSRRWVLLASRALRHRHRVEEEGREEIQEGGLCKGRYASLPRHPILHRLHLYQDSPSPATNAAQL